MIAFSKGHSKINKTQLARIAFLYDRHSYKAAIEDLHIMSKTDPNRLTYTEAELLIKYSNDKIHKGGNFSKTMSAGSFFVKSDINENMAKNMAKMAKLVTQFPTTNWNRGNLTGENSVDLDVPIEAPITIEPNKNYIRPNKTKQPPLKKKYNSIWNELAPLPDLLETAIPEKMSKTAISEEMIDFPKKKTFRGFSPSKLEKFNKKDKIKLTEEAENCLDKIQEKIQEEVAEQSENKIIEQPEDGKKYPTQGIKIHSTQIELPERLSNVEK